MRRENIYLSTIANDASKIARKYGLGIEIAEYCTAWNMDDEFTATDASVQVKLDGIERKVLHAPFNGTMKAELERSGNDIETARKEYAETVKSWSATYDSYLEREIGEETEAQKAVRRLRAVTACLLHNEPTSYLRWRG